MARKKEPKAAIATKGEKTEKKRVGRPPDTQVSPSNVNDETYKEFAARALRAKAAKDEAHKAYKIKDGEYRAELKAAKKAGINPDALTDWLRDKDRDPLELQAELRAKSRLYRLMNMPAGTQFDMLAEQSDLSESTDRGILQERAYQAGMTDGKSGQPLDEDRYPNDSDCQDRYAQGHGDGTEELRQSLSGMKPNGGADAAATAH